MHCTVPTSTENIWDSALRCAPCTACMESCWLRLGHLQLSRKARGLWLLFAVQKMRRDAANGGNWGGVILQILSIVLSALVSVLHYNKIHYVRLMYVLCMSYVCLMYVLCMSYVCLMYYVLSIFVLCFVPWMVSLSSICHFLPLPILLLNICPYHSLSACISVSIYNPYVYWFLSPCFSLCLRFHQIEVRQSIMCMHGTYRDGYLYTLHIYARTMGWRWTCMHSSAYPCVWMHITYVCRTGVCKICMCSVVRHAGAHQHPHRNQCNIRHVYI